MCYLLLFCYFRCEIDCLDTFYVMIRRDFLLLAFACLKPLLYLHFYIGSFVVGSSIFWPESVSLWIYYGHLYPIFISQYSLNEEHKARLNFLTPLNNCNLVFRTNLQTVSEFKWGKLALLRDLNVHILLLPV